MIEEIKDRAFLATQKQMEAIEARKAWHGEGEGDTLLDECETVIEQCLDQISKSFYVIGKALETIRDQKLYRKEFQIFDTYCQGKWGISRSRASRLINAAKVYDNLQRLLPVGNKLPENERQIRGYSKLPPADQVKLWQQTLDAYEAIEPEVVDAELMDDEEEVEQQVAPPPKTPNLRNPNPSNELYTPKKWIGLVREFYDGQIDLDPTSDPGRRIPARQHYTRKENGLVLPWEGKVFGNPPYNEEKFGDKKTTLIDWSRKVEDEFSTPSEQLEELLWLVPNYSAERWFQVLLSLSPLILLIDGRMAFEDGSGQAQGSARFSSVLLYFGERTTRFCDHFGEEGVIVQPMSLLG